MAQLIVELADRIGREEFTAVCVDLMRGAPREDHLDALPWLTGHDWSEGEPVRDPTSWHDYWLRTWGARGLLHVWDDPDGTATSAVVAGLDDEHWRPAEMCLKVVAAHDVAGAGDGAARSPTTSCRGSAPRRCGRWRSPETPSTSGRTGPPRRPRRGSTPGGRARREQLTRRLDLA